MAWGYEASFTIEHDNTLKRKIDCKDCLYYDSNDKSCQKRPLYLPEDGYNSWRTCKYFELNHSVSHYEQKRLQYLSMIQNHPKYESYNNSQKTDTSARTNCIKKTAAEKILTEEQCKNYKLIFCNKITMPKYGVKDRYIYVNLKNGSQREIRLGIDKDRVYVNINEYPKECINEIRRIFHK